MQSRAESRNSGHPKTLEMKVQDSGGIARCTLRIARLLGTLVCWIVFFFWGFQAIQKFLSDPVSSSISVTNGDDGHGNLIYPAITICLRNFHSHLQSILLGNNQRRCSGLVVNYESFLQACISMGTSDSSTTTTTTTESFYGFGDWFGDDDDNYELFETVEEFMNGTKVEIFDVIKTFEFGSELKVTKIDEELRKETLNRIWSLTFDKDVGPCFTFDPARHNVSFMPSFDDFGEPLRIVIELSVSFTFNEF